MKGTKAKEDTYVTTKEHHSYIEFNHGQGFVPVVKHRRYSHIWSGNNGWYTPTSVVTEVIEVRARLNKKLRKK